MGTRFYDVKNGFWYEKQGTYYLLCLEVPEEKNVFYWYMGVATLALFEATSQSALY